MLSDMVSILTALPIRAPERSERQCPVCGPQPTEAFGTYKHRLQSFCKECNRAYQKVWYKKAKASGKR